MAQYQAGMLVVYGKLGVHEIETVGLQSFCGKPTKITILFALIFRIPTTRTFALHLIVPRLGDWLPRGSSTKFVSCNLRRMFRIILVQNCLCKFPAGRL